MSFALYVLKLTLRSERVLVFALSMNEKDYVVSNCYEILLLVVFREDIAVVGTAWDKMAAMVPRIQQLYELFTDPDCSQPNAFTQVLHFLCDAVSDKHSLYKAWLKEADVNVANTDGLDVGQFAGHVEAVISSILMAVQKLTKQHAATETEQEGSEGNGSQHSRI